MLFQVIYTWVGNCKLQKSVGFMIVLLVLLLLKSLALIVEAVLWLIIFDDQIGTFARLFMTSCSEFVNWVSTQIIIWLVAMRYYESTIPIKRLSLNMQAE